MSQSDPVGDLLTSLRNASRAKKAQVDVPSSRLKVAVVDCLKKEGFIQNWRKLGEGDSPPARQVPPSRGGQGILRVYLKYTKDRRPVLQGIRRVSKPGLRIYVTKAKIPKVLSGIGISILSTPHGVLTGNEAKLKGLGGEVICHVW